MSVHILPVTFSRTTYRQLLVELRDVLVDVDGRLIIAGFFSCLKTYLRLSPHEVHDNWPLFGLSEFTQAMCDVDLVFANVVTRFLCYGVYNQFSCSFRHLTCCIKLIPEKSCYFVDHTAPGRLSPYLRNRRLF